MIKQDPCAPAGKADAPRAARRVVAHVDLDAFFTSVEQLLNPALAGQPVVVGGAANQRGVVASASYEARARGVYVPMPLVRAYRVCPEAHFLPGRHSLYSDFSRRVFEVINRFSPTVERASIDEGYLDWTAEQCGTHQPVTARHGAALPVHWPLALAESLRLAVLAETGLSVSVGIGANRLVAKIASKHCKPRGICHVATGAERAFLRPLPLAVVPGIGKRATEVLAANSLVRFADAQDTDDATLARCLGDEWARRLRRIANGEGRVELSPHEAPKGISNESTFRQDCRDLDTVRRTLYRLVEKAAWRLRRAGLVTGSVAVKLRTADFRTRTHTRTLGYHSDCHAELYRVAAQLFEDFAPRHQAIRLIGVQLANLAPATGCQLLLFDSDRRAVNQQVDRLLDRVRAQHGFSGIATAAGLHAARRPVRGG
ncbi:MAG: DNA polymerase IV [Phycisphaerales bacterium]|nr:DNA polymerase IV [Phycisphaerales bacterium]